MGNTRPDSGHCRVPSKTSCGKRGPRTEHWQLSGVGVQPETSDGSVPHLQQHVVHLSQKFLVMLISLNRLFRHLDEMQLWARGLNHLGFPDARLDGWCKGLQLRLSPQPPATHGVRGLGSGSCVVRSLQKRRPSTFGIRRTFLKSGLNSTGLIRTSVA